MGLGRYRKIRKFEKTPEPAGATRPPKAKGAEPQRTFVVQEHHARRHHFDFRLEWRGVLKSWAVPKGPSMVPGERRLAVEVEDHPLEYGSFEGVIPEGNYGAGTVALWDHGTWEPEGNVDAGLAEGELKFRLDGRKLKGRFALVRIAPKKDEKPGKPAWLLLKEKSDVAPNVDAPLTPALCTLVDKVPEGPGWVFEPKFDGYRLLLEKRGKRVRVWTRSGEDWTERFPALVKDVQKLPAERAVLDGEACVLDQEGRPSFEALVEAISQRSDDIVFFVFDLLQEGELNLCPLPLHGRKARLAALVERHGSDAIRYVQHVGGSGATFLEAVSKLGLEGAIAKRVDAPYAPGRTDTWRKIKVLQRQEVVLCGYTESDAQGRPLGALLAGVYQGKSLHFAGKIGTGFSDAEGRKLRKRLDALRTSTPPVVDPPKERRAVWVKPELVAEVTFREWTTGGRLRHPSYIALREDKPARSVVREEAAHRRASSEDASSEDAADEDAADEDASLDDGADPRPGPSEAPSSKPPPRVRMTHGDKVLDPSTGLTKNDLAAYFSAVSEHLLTYARRRPLALVRCPDGLDGQQFFQKRKLPGMGDDIHEARSGDEHMLFVIDEAGLLTLAQFATIELHGWGSPLARLEQPDLIVMDLDPDEGLPFAKVVDAAYDLRETFAQLGMKSYVKTTGGKGLHVEVPLARGHSWPLVSAFTEALARLLAERSPDKYTASIRKASRKGKIFVDHLRNRRGSTAVLPFSTRARPGLTVAYPVPWADLPKVEPASFHVRTVPALLAKRRKDPWAGFYDELQQIPKEMMGTLRV